MCSTRESHVLLSPLSLVDATADLLHLIFPALRTSTSFKLSSPRSLASPLSTFSSTFVSPLSSSSLSLSLSLLPSRSPPSFVLSRSPTASPSPPAPSSPPPPSPSSPVQATMSKPWARSSRRSSPSSETGRTPRREGKKRRSSRWRSGLEIGICWRFCKKREGWMR